MIYELLQADTGKELEVKINEKLNDSWELYGGLVTVIQPNSSEVRSGSGMAFNVESKIILFQAVIKNESASR